MSEFDILIRQQKRPISSRQKTLVRPGRRYEDLGRRRLSNKIYLRFFDLGQYANGAERTFPIELDRSPLTLLYDAGLFNYNTFAPREPLDYTGHLAAYNSHLLSGDVDDWQDTYKEVFGDENIEWSVNTDSAYTANKGYQFTPNEFADDPDSLTFAPTFELLWYPFTTDENRSLWHTKITRNPDYSDTDVDLVLNHDASVFLVPSLKLWDGRAGEVEAAGAFNYIKKNIYLFGHFVKQVPRDFTRTDLFADFWVAPTTHAGQFPGGNWPVTSVISDDIKTAFYDCFTSQTEAGTNVIDYKTFNADWIASGVLPDMNDYVTGGSFANVLAPGFLYPGNVPPGSSVSTYVTDEPYVRWVTWYRKAGQLLAVIHKRFGSDRGWYYVWSTSDYNLPAQEFPDLIHIYATYASQFNWFGGADRGVTLRQPGA